jgi:hypothetical protein
MIPDLAAGPARNDDVLVRLYLLRDAVAVASELDAEWRSGSIKRQARSR